MLFRDSLNKASRLVRLQNLLFRNERGLKTAELAAACGVSARTIQRDLLDLSTAEVPIQTSHTRHRILRGYFVPPVHLSLPEAVALFLAARLLHRCSDEHNPHVMGALAKLANVLPTVVGEHLQAALATEMACQLGDAAFARVFETIAACWVTRRRVAIRYRGAGRDEAHDYLLAPYLLEPVAPHLAMYVVGDVGPPRGILTFKLERVVRADATTECFTIPEDFDPTAYLAGAWGIMGGAPAVEVALRFSPAVARRVRESTWHASQHISDAPDGGVLLRLRVSHTIEVVPWIRGWGPDVEVLEPVELRERIAADMQRAAEQYYHA